MSLNNTIRSDVESLFLTEMVKEDRCFLFIGENDDSIIDEMVDATIKSSNSLFEKSSFNEDSSIDKDINDPFINTYGILNKQDHAERIMKEFGLLLEQNSTVSVSMKNLKAQYDILYKSYYSTLSGDEKFTLAKFMESLIILFHNKSPEEIIEKLPGMFIMIRYFLHIFMITDLITLNPFFAFVYAIMAVIFDIIVDKRMQLKSVNKAIEIYEKEILESKACIKQTKNKNEIKAYEKYIIKLEEDVQKLKDYAQQTTDSKFPIKLI